jgi:hypothetical protein
MFHNNGAAIVKNEYNPIGLEDVPGAHDAVDVLHQFRILHGTRVLPGSMGSNLFGERVEADKRTIK